jgi:hypothetical protein
VERGLLLVVFCSMAITGESPSILSTSGRSRPPKIVWHKKGFYVPPLSFGINSIKCEDDFPEPEKTGNTTSFSQGLKHLYF